MGAGIAIIIKVIFLRKHQEGQLSFPTMLNIT